MPYGYPSDLRRLRLARGSQRPFDCVVPDGRIYRDDCEFSVWLFCHIGLEFGIIVYLVR